MQWMEALKCGGWGVLFACLCGSGGGAWAASPGEQLKALSAQAGRSPNAAQGQKFFNATHGGEWSCASCHGALPITPGKHANTGKTIAPLAPAFHTERFTDVAKSEKWFRRNCKDVLARECTAAEKADVLAWLMALKP
ncbi:MAG: cytochrome C [Burkholderiales bacterium PBB4]|nr:MAG: cytochrome C [Burkholderiales bacterium PBB4]